MVTVMVTVMVPVMVRVRVRVTVMVRGRNASVLGYGSDRSLAYSSLFTPRIFWVRVRVRG